MGPIRHVCPRCGVTFDDEDALAKHLEEHKQEPVQTE